MTIYKPIPIEAETAAEVAVAAGQRRRRADHQRDRHRPDRLRGRHVLHLHPDRVTKDNVADTVIADGFYTADDICTGDYAKACEAAGIS